MLSRTYRLVIEYDGTGFRGWQTQAVKRAAVRTVQATLEDALFRIAGQRVAVTGAGRTDAGVHAAGQVAHIRLDTTLEPARLAAALNANLPADIRVRSCVSAAAAFHARFQAKRKTYRYTICNQPHPGVFTRHFSYWVPFRLDIEAMRREALVLEGRHDFACFQTKDKIDRSSVRTISGVNIRRRSGYVYIDITADGFVYNMARAIVGTLLEIGRGKLSAGSMQRILQSRDRACAGPTAPAKGLCLLKIYY